jgi:S-adenosyl methyltransferase
VTEQDEQERRDRWTALGIRTDIPYPARVYDYLLGGTDNFAADREMAELSLRVMPEVLDSARANRKFLARAVRFLCDSGIQQFLDIGTGLPTSPRHMFNGRELVAPGLVRISHWRPDGGRPEPGADRVWGYCGVARI